jgi:ABC-type branched-subunit amino acid transport system ATPase component/ABC-type branched-subunit amino acid transport system permease subunit
MRLRGLPASVRVAAGAAALVAADELLFGRGRITHIGVLPLPTGIPLGILVNGMVIGTLYALVALGLILVYRADRIISFAQVGLGAVPAVLALLLVTDRHVSYWIAAAVMLVGAALTGAFVEVVVMRRFRRSPRLVATVATIGLAQVLAVIEIAMPTLVSGRTLAPPEFPTPFRHLRFELGGVIFDGNYIAILVVSVALMAGLAGFLRLTRYGIAVRASAENADRAALLGIPVRRLSTLVWVVAAVCSAITVFMRAPVTGLSPGASVSPTVLLYGLAAAVVAGMESLPLALLAGMGIGVIDQSAFFGTSKPDLSAALMLPIILGALLLRRGTVSRAFETGVSSFRTLREFRPIPFELRGLPEVRWGRIGMRIAVCGLLLALPLLVGSVRANFASLVVIFAIVGISVVILSGWAGQVSLGQFAFCGIGAAVAGGLAVNHHQDFFVTLLAAGLAGAAAALLIGLPALRVQGLFLAVVTLAFAVTVQNVVLDRQYTSWLLPGLDITVGRPILYGALDVRGDVAFYYVCLGALALAWLCARSLRASHSGRSFIAVRDNLPAAQAVGTSATRARLAAFAISGFIAAVAGALLAYQQQAVDRPTFGVLTSLEVFVFVVVGGLTSLPGALLGALYYEGLRYVGPAIGLGDLQVLASGVGVLLLLLVAPGGLASAVYGVRDRLLRAVARRRGLMVPSLVADGGDGRGTVHRHRHRRHRGRTAPAAGHTGGTAPLLVCEELEIAYDSVQVLFGVSAEVRQGEVVALLGTNGAGKSTLLRAVCGLMEPLSGRIVFEGRDITGAGPGTAARLGIALVPGGRGVFPTLSVADHLRLAAWLLPRDRVEAAQTRVLDSFPRLRERLGQRAGDLSGGEQQQLALAMAFMAEPRLLIVDELSLGLAPVVVAQLLERVREFHEQGTTVVLVEQSLEVSMALASRTYFMEKGEIRFEGTPDSLSHRDDLVRSVFLSQRAPAGTTTVAAAEPAAAAEPTTVLSVRALRRSFGGIQAVDGVDLRLGGGEILGLIGPNGSGKTTLCDLVSGFLEPDGGGIELEGVEVGGWSPERRARSGLGRSFQDARIFPSLTVAENLAQGLERHLPVRDHLSSALGLPAMWEQEDEVGWTVADLVELMGLGAYRDKFVRELSTGTRRVVDLAMILAHNPSVVLLDEPSSGIAQRETEALGPMLRRVRAETGCAMLVIAHDMPLISAVCDRLVALDLGRVIADGTPAAVLADPVVVAAYLGAAPAGPGNGGGNGHHPGATRR